MYRLVLSILVVIFLLSIFNFSGKDVNSKALKTTKVNYPVKVHVLGETKGEILTYYVDGGLAQNTEKNFFVVNLSSGNHSICVKNSVNKGGIIDIYRDTSPMIQDFYINLQLENNICQNKK